MTDCAILRIALSLNVQHGYARETLRGILDAAPSHQGFGDARVHQRGGSQQWRLKLFTRVDDPGGHRQRHEIQSFAPHGIIYENLRLGDHKDPHRNLRRLLKRIAGPKIELYPFGKRPEWPAISSDDVAVARMAVEYFQSLGLRHFAFLGDEGHEYSRVRRAGFENALRPPESEEKPNRKISGTVSYYDYGKRNWRAGVRAWIGSLQLPVGIFCATDLFATDLIHELAYTSWGVPDQVAVLGVDNDDLLCKLAYPQVSSVVPGFRQVGRAAVGLLAQMLTNSDVEVGETFIAPLRVVARQSTDILCLPDAQVAAAVRYIRSHAMDNISVKELVQKVPGNRRRLEKKFADVVGRTPMEEIHRVRIGKAKELLRMGKSVEEAAYEMHFSSPKYFATLFRRITGVTPSEFKLRDGQPLTDKSVEVLSIGIRGKRRTGKPIN